MELLEKEKNEKEHSQSRPKSECWDTKTEIWGNRYSKCTEEPNWMSTKCATQEDKLKEAKSKLKNQSKSFS